MQEEREAARTNLERVKTTLQHAIRWLCAPERVGRASQLSHADQHAVRILQSRLRLMNRMWNAIHGEGAVKEIAMAELHFTRPDRGDLFQLGTKWHGVSRLDCRACDLIELTGGLLPKTGAKICTVCERGVMHLFTTRIGVSEPQKMPVPGVTPPLPLKNTLSSPNRQLQGLQEPGLGGKTGPGSRQWRVFQFSECDNCHAKHTVNEYMETETPKDMLVGREFRL